MRNALVIFRKDVRRLWPQIAIFLALVATQFLVVPGTTLRPYAPPLDITGLLPLAWCYLIVTVIQQERIPGDRQYWLTRPLTGFEIFIAKAIFIVVFLHLPLLISHAAELVAIGMAADEILPGLLWRQCLLAAIVTLPAAAIAAATRNLAQFVFAAVAIGAAFAGIREMLIEHWAGPWWIPPGGVLVAALAAAAALRMLYTHRDIVRARVVLGVAIALVVVAMFTDADEFTPIRVATGPPQVDPNSPHALQAWIRLEGVPPTAQVFVDTNASPSVGLQHASIRNYADGRGFLVLSLADIVPSFQFAGQLELTLYMPRTSIEAPRNGTVRIPGIGVCTHRVDGADRHDRVICFSPKPRLALAVGTSYDRMEWIVPPAHFEMPSLFQAADIYSSYTTLAEDHLLQLIPARVLTRVRGRYNLTGARP